MTAHITGCPKFLKSCTNGRTAGPNQRHIITQRKSDSMHPETGNLNGKNQKGVTVRAVADQHILSPQIFATAPACRESSPRTQRVQTYFENALCVARTFNGTHQAWHSFIASMKSGQNDKTRYPEPLSFTQEEQNFFVQLEKAVQSNTEPTNLTQHVRPTDNETRQAELAILENTVREMQG